MAVDQITDFETSEAGMDPVPDVGSLPTPAAPAEAVEPPHEAVAETPEAESEEEKPEGDLQRDPRGRFRRGRAASQQASPEDVPRIAALTKKYRDLEREFNDFKAKATPAPEPKLTLPSDSYQPPQTADFTVPMPKLEDFMQAEDPYGELLLAKADWRQAKRAAEWQSQQVKAQGEQQAQASAAQWQTLSTTYQGRVQEFVKTHPDFVQKLEGLKDQMVPPVIQAVIYQDDNGPDLVYKLLDRPDVLAAAHLLADGRPVTTETVASAQRWLHGQLRAAPTGSERPAPRSVIVGPRPPNPVRTGPQPPSDDGIAADDSSLEEHERKHYVNPRDRRRRRLG